MAAEGQAPERGNGAKIPKRSGVARNASAILASDVVNRATTFLIYVLVARYLGAFEFGQLSLGLTFFLVLQAFAGAGLRGLITREVARDASRATAYLVNGSFLVLVLSIVLVLLLIAFSTALSYGASTTAVVVLLALGIVPYGLSTVADGIFQGWQRMHYIAIANVPAHAAKLGVAAALLSGGQGLYAVVGTLVAAHVTVVLIQWWLLKREGAWRGGELSLSACRRLGRHALPFAGIDAVSGLRGATQVIVVSAFLSEVEIGLYSSAAQMLMPIFLAAVAIERSVFPRLCTAFQQDRRHFARVAGSLNEALLTLMIPAAVGLFFLGDRLLAVLYGAEFEAAGVLVQILAWMLVFRAFTASLGRVLLAGGLETTNFQIVLVNLVFTLGLSVALVQAFGLEGAAIAAVVAATVIVVQHVPPALRVAGRRAISPGIWRPIVAALAMSGFLAFAADQALAVAAIGAVGVYLIVLALATMLSAGSPRRARALYLGGWSRRAEGPS